MRRPRSRPKVIEYSEGGTKLKGVLAWDDAATGKRPRVLVAHGRDDAFIPAERIDAFRKGLDRVGADWEMTIYSGTRHSFTNPDAGSYGIANLAYNKTADERSWAAMMKLFGEVLN